MLKLINAFIIFVLTAFCITMNAQAETVFQQGKASYYGKAHHGKKTASGKRFNMHAMTAAHRSLPFGTQLKVTSKDTGKSVIVTINDRGPYAGGRILDLSQEAARQLGMIKQGVGVVTLEKMNVKQDSVRRSSTERIEEPLLVATSNIPDDIHLQIDPIAKLIQDLGH